MSLVEKINALCRENKITSAELERRVGLTRCIYRWDSATPSIDKVALVADYFGVSIDSLLGRSVSPAPSLSPEALTVALAYEAADDVDRELVHRALGLQMKKGGISRLG